MSDDCRQRTISEGSRPFGRYALVLVAAGLLLAVGLYLEFWLRWPGLVRIGGPAGVWGAAEAAYLVAALLAGPKIFRNAWRDLLRLRPGMNFLMTLAAVGAFAIGHGEEGAAVLLLFAVAEELEEYAETRAHSSISELLELAPETARVRRDGTEAEVPTDEVEPGETLLLRPGDKVPLDGVVREGSSTLNEAAITGESLPVQKDPGSRVFAGSLVNEGYLEVETTKVAGDTVLARIVELVEEAEERRAPTERFVDRFARVYTPLVLATAALVALVPPLLLGRPFEEWLYRGLVLLVIACPCALVISTPVSFVSAITSAARHGVLIKGSEYIEGIRKARVVAFDKTGTLTEGRLAVETVSLAPTRDAARPAWNGGRDAGAEAGGREVPGDAGAEAGGRWVPGEARTEAGVPRGAGRADEPKTEEEILRLVAALESRSGHPVARALVQHARERGLDPEELEEPREFESLPGKGIVARHGGRLYWLGSPAFLRDQGLEVPDGIVDSQHERGRTVVLLADADAPRILARFAVSDRPRANARRAIRELQARGLRTVMLTGDVAAAAEAVAEQIGIGEVLAGLLPDEKVQAVRRLAREEGGVIAVGDGVNDAPALAEATVGIAMGVAGTDVALETADVALMRDDLDKLPYLADLSRRTLSIVRQNVFASIVVKGSLGLLALGGMVSLWVAVAVGDMGLSLAVILNAFRIGFLTDRPPGE